MVLVGVVDRDDGVDDPRQPLEHELDVELGQWREAEQEGGGLGVGRVGKVAEAVNDGVGVESAKPV